MIRGVSTVEIPTNLKHKPVLVVENYDNADGKQAFESDAKGLSLGLADTNNPMIDEDIKLFHDIWQKDGEILGERFRILKRLLEEAGY